jgi:hypothetical protein
LVVFVGLWILGAAGGTVSVATVAVASSNWTQICTALTLPDRRVAASSRSAPPVALARPAWVVASLMALAGWPLAGTASTTDRVMGSTPGSLAAWKM